MEQLSAMDASFLYIESPSMLQHVLGVMLFDAAGSEGRFSVERFRQGLRDRLHLMPAFSRRLVEVPLHLDHPYWVHDEDVDLDEHLRTTTCPAPGDLEALGRLVGDIGSRQLPRDRPLWELWLVEGLASGQVALIAKMHHSTIYGSAGADMMAHLLDLTPDGREVEPAAAEAVEAHPSSLGLLARAGVNTARRPALAAQTLVSSARRAGQLGGLVVRSVTSKAPVTLPFSAPRSLLNGPLTPARQAAFSKVDFADIKRVKDAYGTKVNDVVLAAVADALRAYFVKRDALPSRALIASCPMNLGAGAVEGTNKLTAMMVPLPVLTADPVERLREVAAATQSAKGFTDALGPEAVGEIAELMPALIIKTGSRLYDGLGLSRLHPPLQSLVVSNMPGPPIPLYCAGARVDAVFPLGPLLPGAGLNITVLSNMGSLDVGMLCCPDLVPDVWEIADAFPAAIATLLDRAPA
ncbi:MAG: wax ester/triacylglycerol synthase family O-acyltransferase [Frankiales bacterium]|jgi:diacylglycerol O-acyltransferase|nr:wax ester/triacylglycerol synthase family O-acyltransferase [Frankiales bacterium]